MPDIFEYTVKIRIDRDMVPGTGYTSESWFRFMFADLLRQGHYHSSVELQKVDCIRNGKVIANASDCKTLDDILETMSREAVAELMAQYQPKEVSEEELSIVVQAAAAYNTKVDEPLPKDPIYYIDEKANVIELKAKRGLAGVNWESDGGVLHFVNLENSHVERVDANWIVNGEFTLYYSREEIDAILKKGVKNAAIRKDSKYGKS